ncbi:MAG: 5-methyltetrahydropteroyltriglutamate--homocysteine S-methyltransferase [Streptosporangiaceae bacterium]
MAPRTAPPYRADHVGSLLRPPELLRARDDLHAGRITAAQLRETEDRAIRDAVRMQEEIGLQSATDGEYRRREFHLDFIYRIRGIVKGLSSRIVPAHTREGRDIEYLPPGVRVTGKLGLTETIFGDDFRFLASAARDATPKQTIPSPSMVHFLADVDPGVYRDPRRFRADVAETYAEEVRRLSDLGCTYLQLDDTIFGFLGDPVWRERAVDMGGDPEHQHEVNVTVINQALAARPRGLTVTVHICRGNYQSSWFSEGGYDYVAEPLFSQLEVDGFFLEYDDARAGTFEPLRFVPDDKMVVLGLITTKTPALESKDDVKRRVEEAARFVPVERLCLSPQCGFASTAEGNALTRDQQRAKLELLLETAADIWG